MLVTVTFKFSATQECIGTSTKHCNFIWHRATTSHACIGGVEVQLHAVLTSALDWYEQLHAPNCFTHGENPPVSTEYGVRGAPRPESRDRRLMEEKIPFVLSQQWHRLAGSYRRFGSTYRSHIQGSRSQRLLGLLDP